MPNSVATPSTTRMFQVSGLSEGRTRSKAIERIAPSLSRASSTIIMAVTG